MQIERVREELKMQIGPLERVHCVCLLYVQGNVIDSGTFVRLMGEQFSRERALEWLRRETDLRLLARVICRRDPESLRGMEH